MSDYLNTLLPFIKSGLNRELVSGDALARLENLMSRLPLLSGGVECPLGPQSETADLAVRLTARDGGFMRLAEDNPLELDERSATQGGWQRIREFARARNERGNMLHDAVKESWLEFDLDQQPDDQVVRQPNFFFKLEPHWARPPLLGPEVEPRVAQTTMTVAQGLARLGLSFTEKWRETLERHVRRIPASANLTFVGVMLQRNQSSYRLTLGNFPLTELTAYLVAVGWPHEYEPILPLINFFLDNVQTITIHLDIAERTLDRLGFEMSFDPKRDQAEAWRNALQSLVAANLCAPKKAASVQLWPERFHRARHEGGWPRILGQTYNYFVRSINHVKINYDPTAAPDLGTTRQPLSLQASRGALTAKAYLAFNYAML